MKHVDMRKLPAAAQEERRRQVIGLRRAGLTYDAIAAQVGLSPTGVVDICKRFAERGRAGLRTGPRQPDLRRDRVVGQPGLAQPDHLPPPLFLSGGRQLAHVDVLHAAHLGGW